MAAAQSNPPGARRQSHKLSHRTVQTAKPGRYGDGAGLWLVVSPSGARKWVFRFSWQGRVTETGLGSCPAAELAEAFLAAKQSQWRNLKHRAQLRMTLRVYCVALWEKPVAEIATADVLAVLQPLWQASPETASRLRGRVEAVLDAAKAQGLRSGENPARWRGHLDKRLARRQKLSRGHHAAMPYVELPAFIASLRERESAASLALEFLILTAARTGEAIGARWGEIDFVAKVWTVPAERMKAGKEHRVPLSGRAMEILEKLAGEKSGEFIFAGQRRGKPLSSMALAMLLRRMKVKAATAHGFRSSFRDWAGDCTHFPREIAEAALAHAAGDETERAYRRGDALEKRRELMEAWASYCQPKAGSNVIHLVKPV